MDLDDKLLDHPKFIRAAKRGGSEAVHMWLGLRQYVAQNLSDGFIPEDMVDEVRGPPAGRKREAALAVLREVGLLEGAAGGVQLHDYLQWSKSRERVLAERKAARDRQERSRANRRGESQDVSRVTDSVSNTSLSTPLHSSPIHSKPDQRARDPEPDRETICPADIVDRLEIAGVFKELSGRLKLSPAALRAEAERGAGYWLAGKGMGKRRRNWPGVFRQRLLERADQGEIPEVDEPDEAPPPDVKAKIAAMRGAIGG